MMTLLPRLRGLSNGESARSPLGNGKQRAQPPERSSCNIAETPQQHASSTLCSGTRTHLSRLQSVATICCGVESGSTRGRTSADGKKSQRRSNGHCTSRCLADNDFPLPISSHARAIQPHEPCFWRCACLLTHLRFQLSTPSRESF